MSTSKSSRSWLDEHEKDPYVIKARREGYRSRAVYKLIEINEKDKLLSTGMTVLDLGAAPGSWSEYVVKKIGPKGKVIAIDILAMEPIKGVTFIQGDFSDETVYQTFLEATGGVKADLVLSDIAPNLSGVSAVDGPRAMALVELALECALENLKPGGNFLVKVFQGVGFEAFVKRTRIHFQKMITRKPKASRPRSNEVYILAKGLKKG